MNQMNGKSYGVGAAAAASDNAVNGCGGSNSSNSGYSSLPATAATNSATNAQFAAASSSPSSALGLLLTKTAEVDLGERERDRFSPVSDIGQIEAEAAEAACRSSASGRNGNGVIKMPATHFKIKFNNSSNGASSSAGGTLSQSTSKEEKQRQNEELAIMETTTTAATAEDFALDWNNSSSGTTSACFIDASSLRDEDEQVLLYPSIDGNGQINEKNEIEPALNKSEVDDSTFYAQEVAEEIADVDNEDVDDDDNDDDDDSSPTKQLEKFHNQFAKCKLKTKETTPIVAASISNSNSSSNSGNDTPPEKNASLTSPASANNLSDEEKLWKRELNSRSSSSSMAKAPTTTAAMPIAAAANDAASLEFPDLAKFKRDHGAEQLRLNNASPNSYVYHQNNKKQFTVHPLNESPKFAVTSRSHDNSSSAGMDYSSSSPCSSLAWSSTNFDNQQHEHEYEMHHPHPHHHQHQHHQQHQHKPANAGHLLPGTPHNSIVHIDASDAVDAGGDTGSGRSCTPRDHSTTLSSSFSHQRDSGAYCSDAATDSPIPMPRTPKRSSKFDESNPIVSGGASIKDFSNSSKSGHDSSTNAFKRRTDTCPIVSGGFVSLDFEQTKNATTTEDEEEVELRVKPPPPRARNLATWIVDMSDCRSAERRKSTSSSSSLENSALAARVSRERSDSTSSHASGCGFYVSLNGNEQQPTTTTKPTRAKHENSTSLMSKSYTTTPPPRSSEFFVNLTKSEMRPGGGEALQAHPQDPTPAPRKPMFSMFIDIGEERKSSPPAVVGFHGATRPQSSAASSLNVQQQNLKSTEETAANKSNASSTETLMSRSANLKLNATSQSVTAANEQSDVSAVHVAAEQPPPPLTVSALRRLTQQKPQSSEQISKRHSWGQSPRNVEEALNDCKRSISLTAANGNSGGGGGDSGLMSIIDKIPLIAKASTLSVDSSLSAYDEMSTWSNNSARNSMSPSERDTAPAAAAAAATGVVAAAPRLQHGMRHKKRRCDVQINETFDKSSLASITDGVLSNDLSPASTTDTDDLTFQQDEELAIREALLQQQQQHELTISQPAPPQPPPPMTSSQLLASSTSNRSSAIMETIIEAKETSSPKKSASGHTLESLHATIEKQKMLLETFNEHGGSGHAAKAGSAEKSNFVKLSDMDKPISHQLDMHSPEPLMSKSVGGGGGVGVGSGVGHYRQSSMHKYSREEPPSITASSYKGGGRPHSWTMTRSHGNSFLNITNSIENLRSLSRLFPHFSKEFSNSLPNELLLDHQQQQLDYIQTDISTDSSLTSSFSRSGLDESSISCRQPRRLGEDLLKMFLQEIATDMVVEVHGRRIKAHKCILRSRCQYFAAMLAGNGAQSGVVSLQGYSYAAVHFALCHIYSGASHPPDGISLMELAALADLLGLEGLKEVTTHALKTNYCHNFHKPCSGCIDGIMQVLPVALNHALDDLYRKCLRWTCRHYLKVWPTRQFAQLPPDILSRCRQQLVAHLTPETVLDTVLDCENLLRQLAAQRWGGICENLVRDILDAAHFYIGDHFASLIASDAFLSLGHNRSCHIPQLENVFLSAASTLTPDQACRSYQRITRLNTVLQAKVMHIPTNMGELAKELQGLGEENLEWDTDYVCLVGTILTAVEQCLISQCVRAMRVTAWQRMDLDLRKKIQTLARLTEPNPNDQKKSKPVSKAFSFSGGTTTTTTTRNQELYQVKLAIQAHSKRGLGGQQELPTFKAATQAHNGLNAQNLESAFSGHVNYEAREGVAGKIFKSASVTQVPKTTYKSSVGAAPVFERKSLPTQKCASSINVASSNKTNKPQTEAPPKPAKLNPARPAVPRLVDVRPRYLEPRKSRTTASNTGAAPVRSSSAIQASGVYAKAKNRRQISSSDSSRNSSPAPAPLGLVKSNAASAKINSKSTDSLGGGGGSPMRRGRNVVIAAAAAPGGGGGGVGIHHSLIESMKSSNKTISQESLSSPPTLSWSNPHLFPHEIAKQNKNFQLSAKAKQLPHAAAAAAATHLASPGGSSPSSRTTTKSVASRLSSVSSTQSTRDAYKRRSISMTTTTGQQQQQHGGANYNNNNGTPTTNQRRSFLSAKSREILAKRAEKNRQLQQELQNQQQQQQTSSSGDEQQRHQQQHSSSNAATGLLRAVSYSAVPCAALSNQQQQQQQQQSNIPTRRHNNNATAAIQYKKTHTASIKKSSSTVASAQQQQQQHQNNVVNALAKSASNVIVKTINKDKAAAYEKDARNNLSLKSTHKTNQTTTQTQQQQQQPEPHQNSSICSTSKLERSSTFCKENSDLNLSELQLIE